MLSAAELDACAALIDELAALAIDRIVAERPRADQIGTKTSDGRLGDRDRPGGRAARPRGGRRARSPTTGSSARSTATSGAARRSGDLVRRPGRRHDELRPRPAVVVVQHRRRRRGGRRRSARSPILPARGAVRRPRPRGAPERRADALLGGRHARRRDLLTEMSAQSLWDGTAGADGALAERGLRHADHGLERAVGRERRRRARGWRR